MVQMVRLRVQRIAGKDHESDEAVMTILGISWNLMSIRVHRRQIPTWAALRQSSVGIRLCSYLRV